MKSWPPMYKGMEGYRTIVQEDMAEIQRRVADSLGDFDQLSPCHVMCRSCKRVPLKHAPAIRGEDGCFKERMSWQCFFALGWLQWSIGYQKRGGFPFPGADTSSANQAIVPHSDPTDPGRRGNRQKNRLLMRPVQARWDVE